MIPLIETRHKHRRLCGDFDTTFGYRNKIIHSFKIEVGSLNKSSQAIQAIQRLWYTCRIYADQHICRTIPHIIIQTDIVWGYLSILDWKTHSIYYWLLQGKKSFQKRHPKVTPSHSLLLGMECSHNPSPDIMTWSFIPAGFHFQRKAFGFYSGYPNKKSLDIKKYQFTPALLIRCWKVINVKMIYDVKWGLFESEHSYCIAMLPC